MKIQKKRSFLKKSFALIFGLIFICQIFISFSNLYNLNSNFGDFDFGYNSSSKADSNVHLLDVDEEEMNLEVCISDLEIEDITASTGEVYQRLSIEEGSQLGEIGCPKLPFRTVKILLPYGKDIEDIEIITDKEQVLEGKYKIEPAQESVYIGSSDIPEFCLNTSVYNSVDPFPEERHSVVGVYNSRGYKILILNLHPVCYIPKTGEVSYSKELRVRINLVDGDATNSLLRGIKKDEDHIAELVNNPQLIDTYRTGSLILQSNGDVMCDLGPYDYVIITNEDLKNSNGTYTFQDLAAAKNASGIQTKIVTVEEIYEIYSGIDNQTKIRNFIIDAYQNWGIEYVLLGGDGDFEKPPNVPPEELGEEFEDPIIPSRYLGSWQIPCGDIYYAGLNGTWNADGDLYYGEPEDDPDLLTEVFIGRAPVDSEEELSNFVMKTLAYEASNDPYLLNALMVGENLGWDPWGGDFMDELINGSDAHGYTTEGFPEEYNVETLYERDMDWNKNDLISKINNGVHILNHLGHANVHNVMKFYTNDTHDDTELLQNDKYFFGYTQGCYAGSFDNFPPITVPPSVPIPYIPYDCIVEHLITSEHGAFAFIANSRFGFGNRSSTDSESQHYHREFIDAVFGEGIKEIGRANQDSKEDCLGFINIGMMLFCYYELNLLGDPTVKLKEFQKDPQKEQMDLILIQLIEFDRIIEENTTGFTKWLLNRLSDKSIAAMEEAIDAYLDENYCRVLVKVLSVKFRLFISKTIIRRANRRGKIPDDIAEDMQQRIEQIQNDLSSVIQLLLEK